MPKSSRTSYRLHHRAYKRYSEVPITPRDVVNLCSALDSRFGDEYKFTLLHRCEGGINVCKYPGESVISKSVRFNFINWRRDHLVVDKNDSMLLNFDNPDVKYRFLPMYTTVHGKVWQCSSDENDSKNDKYLCLEFEEFTDNEAEFFVSVLEVAWTHLIKCRVPPTLEELALQEAESKVSKRLKMVFKSKQ